MNLGYFNYPLPVNERVLDYAPGSPERKKIKEILGELKKSSRWIFQCISAARKYEQIKKAIHPPHEIARTLGYFHAGEEKHVQQAIEAALAAKESWANTSWETRRIFF